jgi:hypothetical protein
MSQPIILRRVVLFGPPLAGKGTLLRALAHSRSARVEQADVPCGAERIPQIVLRLVAGEAAGPELMTIPGSPWNIDCWDEFLVSATSVVLVLDPQAEQESPDRLHIAHLSRFRPPLGCVAWTKGDLIAKGLSQLVPRTLLAGTPFEGWPSFETRQDEPETLTDALDWPLRQMNVAYRS